MDYILLGTIIGFSALTVLLWSRIHSLTQELEGKRTVLRRILNALEDSDYITAREVRNIDLWDDLGTVNLHKRLPDAPAGTIPVEELRHWGVL